MNMRNFAHNRLISIIPNNSTQTLYKTIKINMIYWYQRDMDKQRFEKHFRSFCFPVPLQEQMWMLCTEIYAESKFFRLPCTLLRVTECPQKTGLRRVNATTLSNGHSFTNLLFCYPLPSFKTSQELRILSRSLSVY